MPLVRVSLRAGKPAEHLRAVGRSVHRAMVETIDVPERDEFQVITEHPVEGLVYDPAYLDIRRTDDVVLIQITLNAGRTVEQKKALYARIVELLADEPGIAPADVLISLVEVPKENWSFGYGIAQYAA